MPVHGLRNWVVQNVSIGKNHSAVLTESGHIITMGNNLDYQVGHLFSTPTVVSSISHHFVTVS